MGKTLENLLGPRDKITAELAKGDAAVLGDLQELFIKTCAAGVVQLEIRRRNARVQILQNTFDFMRQIIAARAFKYSADMGAPPA